MTKQQKAEKAEAIAQLRDWIKPGDTVYTILDHVSSSGMSRHIRVVVPHVSFPVNAVTTEGEAASTAAARVSVTFYHPNHAISKALGLRFAKRHGRETDALVVGGAGMDMGFHLVYELSHELYGDGYAVKHQWL